MTAHDLSIESYAVAPDGRTIAYVSGGTLWALTPNPDIATPILTAEGISAPAFNADGTQIFYQMPDGIYALDTFGGEPRLILAGYSAPQILGTSGNLLVRITDGDLGLFDLATQEVKRLGSFERAKPMRDGRLLAAGAPSPELSKGIYMIDPTSTVGAVLLYQTPPGLKIRDFASLANGGVRLLMERVDGLPAPVRVFDVAPTGGAVSIPVVPYLSEGQLSADGETLAGYASGAGTLAVYSIPLASESIVGVPGKVEAVTFPPFR
jgi:hypothetical protein